MTTKNPSAAMTIPDQLADVSGRAYQALAYFEGVLGIAASVKASESATAARVVARNIGRDLAAAARLLDEAAAEESREAKVALSLEYLQDSEAAALALVSTIEAAPEYGVEPEAPAFDGSDPYVAASNLAHRGGELIAECRRRAAAIVRKLAKGPPLKAAA